MDIEELEDIINYNLSFGISKQETLQLIKKN
jgi:hypothetical protein